MKKYLVILLAAIVLPILSHAQAADGSKPLKVVLDEIEQRFGVKLVYTADAVKGKVVTRADYRIRRYSVEESLKNVLAPFDMDATKGSPGVYKVRTFLHSRRIAVEGLREMEYLTDVYKDRETWEKQAAVLRPCIKKALRLDPMPASPGTPPILSAIRKMDGYSVRNFAIEVLPGAYVCGSVYMSAKATGKCPLILNPVGHFPDSRYRADAQIRCAMQARMGAWAVTYDLFGRGESLLQFAYEDHETPMAQTMQALYAFRILDYFTSLPEIDTDRVAMTGASGGGSQTMVITALDDRIKVTAPVVMVSAYFAGGCPCESGLPIHLCGGGMNNVELAALAAPRPQLVVSDGKDWTDQVPVSEYPFMQHIYSLYGKEGLVENAHFPDEGHDYGPSKRRATYPFLAKYLRLDLSAVDESKCTIEPLENLYVFGPKGELLPKHAIKGMAALEKVLGVK